MSEPYIGEIKMFAGNFAPRGWALCDGQLLPIAQNEALFSILGTTYGGDGRTTFGLPDLRGRAPVHAGSGPGLTPRNLGQKFGAEQTTLTVPQLPPHAHGLSARLPAECPAAPAPEAVVAYSPLDGAVATDFTTTPAGGAQPVPTQSPATVVNFIIAIQGIYPTRS
jgi:microcystin-dependent protein